MVEFTKNLPEDLFQLLDRGVRNVLLVKAFVGKVELFPEGLAVKGRLTMGSENAIGGFQDGGEVVDEGARPVEDQISNHRLGVAGSFVYIYDYVYERTEIGRAHV